jgi:hypothetical protein
MKGLNCVMNKIINFPIEKTITPVINTKERTVKIEKFTTIPYHIHNSEIDENEKLRIHYFKSIERLIRTSFEYKEFISFMKSELDMGKCYFFFNINQRYMKRKKIGIEIHHTPLTLFDIVSIVYNYNKENDLSLLDLYISQVVMKLHYQKLIGLIPLSTTLHELAHAGELFINTSYIWGEWEQFLTQYRSGFTDEQVNKLDTIRELSSIESGKDKNKILLEKYFTYFEIDGVEMPKLIDNTDDCERMEIA